MSMISNSNPNPSNKNGVYVTWEQLQHLSAALQTAQKRNFTQCTARFSGETSRAAVERFITEISIFKLAEGISDADGLLALSYLFTGEALQWWSVIKNEATTWEEAMEKIRFYYAPREPNYQLFKYIFNEPQAEDMRTDDYLIVQRYRFAQMSRQLDEEWQLDMIYSLLRFEIRQKIPRQDIGSFNDLLTRARVVEDHLKDMEASKPEKRRNAKRRRCECCQCFVDSEAECLKKKKDETCFEKGNKDPEFVRSPSPEYSPTSPVYNPASPV